MKFPKFPDNTYNDMISRANSCKETGAAVVLITLQDNKKHNELFEQHDIHFGPPELLAFMLYEFLQHNDQAIMEQLKTLMANDTKIEKQNLI